MSTQQNGNGNNLIVQGRLVWTMGSSLFEGKRMTDYNTNQVIIGEDGQPVMEYGFGLAIPKIDPRTGQPTAEYQKVWQALHQEAFTLYPSGHLPPDFAMKYKDGDGIDHNGKPFGDREGYKNHLILTCTTRIPIKYFKWEQGNNILVNDGIKCGDYVNAQLNIKAHPAKGRGKPGLYLNPSAVQLIQSGKEIINTPSGDQLFGMNAPAYAGEVVAHVAPTMPNMAPPVAPGYPPPVAPGYPPAAPAPVVPNYGVLPQTHQPAPNMAPPAAPGYPPAAPAYPPVGNGQYAPPAPQAPTQYGQPNTQGGYAQPAYPSNGQYAQPQGAPAMPGMPMPR